MPADNPSHEPPSRRRSRRVASPRCALTRWRACSAVQGPRVEFDDGIADIDGSALVKRLDAAVGEKNEEYLTKRKSLRYGAPVIRVVRSGEFDRYRRRMVESGQRADGQFKVLRLTSDTSFAAEFAAERDLVGGDRTSA